MAQHILDFEKPVLELEKKIEEMRALAGTLDISDQIAELEGKIEELRFDIYSNLTRWQRIQIARHPDRPYTLDYCHNTFSNFTELHGDRMFRDDAAIVGGLASLGRHNLVVIGHQKGRDTKSNVYRNFGMPNPEGYRKAKRLMQLAEKFRKPVVCLLDTQGAYPGIEAEDRGQANAIAENLLLMSSLRTPIVVVVIGEGASGGALGIGVGNRVLMLENAWYSVIAPESCSSILWRSWDFKEQAAEALRLTASDLVEQGVADRIVPEPIGGAHRLPNEIFATLGKILIEELNSLESLSDEELVAQRRDKFANIGVWTEL